MKIVFLGAPKFGADILNGLLDAGREIVAVVCQPDRRGNRNKTEACQVKRVAEQRNLKVFQFEKLSSDGAEDLQKLSADVFITAAYGQMLSEEILSIPKFGVFNAHGSLLPKYRGAAPVQYAVIDGEKESGVTLMRMGTGLDTGDMIAKAVIPLAADETGGSLFDKLAQAGAKLLVETLPSVFDGTAVYEKQPEESPTPYAAMITKQMGLLDFSESAEKLERLIRGLNPWPSAYTFLEGKTLKIWKAAVSGMEYEKNRQEALPGTVVLTDKEGIHVVCGEGRLILQEVQLEGKKRMDAAAFLRGFPIAAGTRLADHKE